MGWEELIDSLDELETKREYDGYFCSVKDAMIILVLGSLCDLRNIKRIHEWAETEHIREYLKTNFNIQRVPCYWWLLSLLAIVTPESLNRCMMTWVSGIAPGLVGKIEEEEKKKGKTPKKNYPFSGREGNPLDGKNGCVRESASYCQCAYQRA